MIIGFDNEIWQRKGVKVPINIELGKDAHVHLLFAGQTGSAKSCTALQCAYRVLDTGEGRIFFADYKGGSEYRLLDGSRNYALGDDAIGMIIDFFDFYQTLRKNKVYLKNCNIIYIEEYFGLLSYVENTQSKKVRTELIAKVSELLSVSRGFSCGVWTLQQRAGAEFYASGSRDNFTVVVHMARISKESRGILFPSEEIKETNLPPGQGLILISGQQQGVREFISPYIINQDEMVRGIRQHIDKQKTLTELIKAVAEGNRLDQL
ncbi:hypothetical protein Q5O14_17740 [Eubacteriaceae bacterium ES2]|nr:hypothetical protein Q5O14_17740 [Eubacteriaceae bacterium ES2]